MGFSGCHIPGHSGTDFKHKKAFYKTKELYKNRSVNHSTNAHTQSFAQTLADRKELERTNFRALLAFIIPVLLFALGFMYHFGALDFLTNASPQTFHTVVVSKPSAPSTNHEKVYTILVESGERFLKEDRLYEAQKDFTKATQMEPYKKEANLGLTKTLILRCQQEQKHCERSKEYFDFTIQLDGITYQDLALLNKLKSI